MTPLKYPEHIYSMLTSESGLRRLYGAFSCFIVYLTSPDLPKEIERTPTRGESRIEKGSVLMLRLSALKHNDLHFLHFSV